jgi:alpha-1,6-mannosyltransferase
MTPAQIVPAQDSLRLGLVAAGLVLLSMFTVRLHFAAGFWGFCSMAILTAVLAAWASTADHGVDTRRVLWIILGSAALMRVPFLLAEPYLSSDLYRYIWDGRVQAHGINPFRFVPAASELAALRDGAIYPNINRADYAPTIYPPAGQILFFLTTRVSESVLAMKLSMVAFEALGLACILDILRRFDLPPQRIAAAAWHPLALWEIAGNAHIDAAMTGCMLLGVWLFVTKRAIPGAVVAAIATLIKPIAIVALPVFWKPWDLRMPAAVVAAVALLYLPYLSVGAKVFGFASGYVAEEGYKAGGGFWYPDLLQAITGPIPSLSRVYLAVALIGFGALALRITFRSDRSDRVTVEALALLVTVFLVLLTPHYPWYYLVAVPFLAFYPHSATLWVITVGGLQMHDVIPNDIVPDYGHRQLAFHSTTLLAILWDWHSRTTRSRMLTSGADVR